MIGEKAVIGSPPDLVDLNHNPTLGDGKGKGEGEGEGGKGGETIISDFVAISPLSSIRSGTVVGEAAVIDTLCTVEGGADVGAHSKVCAGCCVPTGASVGDWMVVWGSGKAFGRRKRFRGVGSGTGSGVDAGLVEESRLVVLKKEREALSRLLVPVGAGGSRRR